MSKPGPRDSDQLAEFESRYSHHGLLVRYARGRVKHLAARQGMILAGGAALMLTNGPVLGAVAMGLALLGEAVDCLYLRRLPDRIPSAPAFRRMRLISTLTAAFQALTIVMCVCLAWLGPVSGTSPFFATAFLAGAAINAGLTLPYHRLAASVRLAIYAVTTAVLNIAALMRAQDLHSVEVLNAVATLLLAYMVGLFLQFVDKGFRRHRATMKLMIRQGQQLARRQREAYQLSLVARNANDSVIVSDAQGRITWVNAAFERVTGYSLREVLGKSPGAILNAPGTDADTIERIGRSQADGLPFRGEIMNATKDGRHIWMETNLVPVRDAAGQVEMWVAVERDVTAARQHASEMAAAREAAERGARAKAGFLATMSHELRTPLNGVIGMTEILLDTDLTPDQHEPATTIRSSARALLAIIDDILDLSRLEARKMTLNPVSFDPAACLRETVQLLRPQADEKGLALQYRALSDIPPRICADDTRLRQILINLVGNAIKFTDSGSVDLTLRVSPDDMGHLLTIEVSDTGIGIAPGKLDRIFERFSQADAAITRTYGGTGLGLTISRELVEMMQGKISVTSQPGQGTRFRVTLPVAAAEPETNRGIAAAPALAALDGATILVADDNKVNRLLIRKYLRGMPVELAFAHDGREVVDAVGRCPPDLILMDMAMPVMNGLEATRAIRARPGPQPTIIALTANTFDSDREACRAAGMDDFLSKPIRRDDLLERLGHYAGLGRELPCPPV